MEGLRPPKKPKTEVVPLTVEQVQLIAESIQPRYSALVLFIATSGLRPGEAFGVTKDRVDWLGRSVRVDRQLVTVGNEVDFSTLKTEASYRTVPLPTLAVELLSEHVRIFELGESDLIFSNAKGEMIQRKRFGEVWRQAMKALDFECKGPHQLRHHYASLLIEHGESVKVVQKRLGHSSATETLNTYAHLWPDSEDSTREAVKAAYSPSLLKRSSLGSADVVSVS